MANLCFSLCQSQSTEKKSDKKTAAAAPKQKADEEAQKLTNLEQALKDAAKAWIDGSEETISVTPFKISDRLETFENNNDVKDLQTEFTRLDTDATQATKAVNRSRANQGAIIKRIMILTGLTPGNINLKYANQRDVETSIKYRYLHFFEMVKRYPWVLCAKYSEIRNVNSEDIMQHADKIESDVFNAAQRQSFVNARQQYERQVKSDKAIIATKRAAIAKIRQRSDDVNKKVNNGDNCESCGRGVGEKTGKTCVHKNCVRRAHITCIKSTYHIKPKQAREAWDYYCEEHVSEKTDEQMEREELAAEAYEIALAAPASVTAAEKESENVAPVTEGKEESATDTDTDMQLRPTDTRSVPAQNEDAAAATSNAANDTEMANASAAAPEIGRRRLRTRSRKTDKKSEKQKKKKKKKTKKNKQTKKKGKKNE